MNTAIYWDYQNVQLKSSTSSTILVDKILDFARERGILGTLRAYANWSSPTIKGETAQNIASAGFELIHVPYTRKNAVDLAISIDLGKAAMSEIETFIIITSDGDFIPALANLRRVGKRTVIIANPDVANERLQIAADDFLPLNLIQFHPEPLEEFPTVESIETEADSITEPSISLSADEALNNAIHLLRKAVLECMEEERSLRYGSVASKLYELDPNLDLKKIPSIPSKRSFQALVTEAVKFGVVSIRDVEGWQELYVPEVGREIEDVPEEMQARSDARQLEENEKKFIEEILTSLDQERYYSLTSLLTKLRHKRNEVKGALLNSELRQLLVTMIEVEIFRKQTDGTYQRSPLWQEIWDKFSEEYRL